MNEITTDAYEKYIILKKCYESRSFYLDKKNEHKFIKSLKTNLINILNTKILISTQFFINFMKYMDDQLQESEILINFIQFLEILKANKYIFYSNKKTNIYNKNVNLEYRYKFGKLYLINIFKS
jgi:hypothetical protein